MSITRGVSTTVLSVAAILILSACSQPAPPPAANSAESAGTASSSTTTTASIDTTGMAPACVTYINTVQACVTRIGGNNPAAAEQFRRQMEDFRRRIAGQDPAAAGQACEQATRIFNGLSRMMGCGS